MRLAVRERPQIYHYWALCFYQLTEGGREGRRWGRLLCWNFRTIWGRFRNRGIGLSDRPASAGILKQSMGARNRVGIGLSDQPARLHRLAESILGLQKNLKIPLQATQAGGTSSLESIPGHLKSLKIPSLYMFNTTVFLTVQCQNVQTQCSTQ